MPDFGLKSRQAKVGRPSMTCLTFRVMCVLCLGGNMNQRNPWNGSVMYLR